uniref:Seroin transcript 1B n=1 Tax=Acanthobrahmaea europaea TaxID=119239 RepID=A0A3G1T157_9NEOP|nr:seroin transcript 1B [Acanthobrahmaea europaea]
MAFKIIFISITLAVVVNGIKWPGFDDKFGLNFPQDFKPHKMPKFDIPTMDPSFFKHLSPDEIRSHAPGPNEHYSASSVSKHTYSSNKNGKKESGGEMNEIYNDNGAVTEKILQFNQKDED